MRWLKRLCVALGIALVLGVAVLAAGSLLSLDWDRGHSARISAALSLLDARCQSPFRDTWGVTYPDSHAIPLNRVCRLSVCGS
jgi:hypothetical protein